MNPVAALGSTQYRAINPLKLTEVSGGVPFSVFFTPWDDIIEVSYAVEVNLLTEAEE